MLTRMIDDISAWQHAMPNTVVAVGRRVIAVASTGVRECCLRITCESPHVSVLYHAW